MYSKKTEYLKRATFLADWFVNNQVKSGHYADRGRFANELKVGKKNNKKIYSTNWTTGMTVISLLMMWQRTKNKKYLDSAILAGEYIKSLQVLDQRNKFAFGMFRETSPQSKECHPRDALSAAWGLLHLYLHTKDEDCLYRVNLFANWFVKYAMKKNYPAWTSFVNKDTEPYWQLGSFHGGSPLFFFDLYDLTKEKRWLNTGLAICKRWSQVFLKPDGSIRIEVDPKTGEDRTGKGNDKNHLGWQEMHKYNDDFTSQAQMRAYKLTGDKQYFDYAKRYLDWAVSVQNKKGYFGKVPVNSAAATLILELIDFAKISKDKKYVDSMTKSITHFLSLQEINNKLLEFFGGYYCIHGDYVHNSRKELGVRTSCYALAALLKLEGKIKYKGYTA